MTIPQKQIWKRIHGIENKATRELYSNYKTALDDIRLTLAKLYEKHGDLTWAEMAKFNRLTKLQDEIVKQLGPLFSGNSKLIAKLQSAEYGQAFYQYCWAIDNAYKVSLNWGLLNPETISAAVDNPLKHIALTRLKQDGLIKVKRAITQGLIRGDGYKQMIGGIRDAINGSRYDALRILRTEGQRAAVLGQQAQAEESKRLGIEVKEIWDASLDTRTRPEHGVMDGKERQADGMFHSPDVGPIAGPLQSGIASFDINCRCSVSEELPDDPPVIRQIQETKEAEPYIKFDDWQKREGLTENKYGQIYKPA